MAYKKNEQTLKKLLELVKQEEEFRTEIEHRSMNADQRTKIDERVLDRQEKIWEAVSTVLEEFQKTENDNNTRFWGKLISAFFGFLSTAGLWFMFNFETESTDFLSHYISKQFLATYYFWVFLAPIAVISAILLGRFLYTVITDSQKLTRAEKKVDDEIINVLRFELRQAINGLKRISYSRSLTVESYGGLEEGYDPSLEVDTLARQYTEKLLSKMLYGSIGVAGPRGTGKTTLLNSSRKFSATGKERIYVQLSAPVKYDAREFILHLYSEVCRSIIEDIDPKRRFRRRRLNEWLPFRFLGNILKPVNLFFILLSLLLVSIAAAFVLDNSGGAFLNYGISTDIVRSGINIFGAIVAILFGLSLYVWLLISAPSLLRNLFPSTKGKSQQQRRDLLKKSYREWQKVKYQQTRSSGWGGTLNLAVFEAVSEQSSSLQEYQMTLPEVTYSYRHFVEDATDMYQFVIAIDEMDKIEDPKQAQSFLNDLKNILALRNCFYLVSVSQNAMSSFELRGLPFRDAFDSTFDEIVHVGYLDLEKATAVLKRRIIGLPEPFIQLAYCVSGGMPRDLIRVTRKIIMSADQHPRNPSLAAITTKLLQEDLIKKLDATRYQLQDKGLTIQTKDYLLDMDELEQNIGMSKILEIGCRFIAVRKAKNSSEFQTLIYHMGLYMIYIVTVMDFFTNPRKNDDFKKAANGQIDTLVVARQRMGISGDYALRLINQFRSEYGLPVIKG